MNETKEYLEPGENIGSSSNVGEIEDQKDGTIGSKPILESNHDPGLATVNPEENVCSLISPDKKSGKNLDMGSFCIEKIYCYELKNFLYVIGSSSCRSRHRILKIDRRCKSTLKIVDNNHKQILSSEELVKYRKIEGFSKIEPTVAFGIVGLVRFLEGYYIILIVKRRCVAIVGCHSIYKIEDTCMLYIPNEAGTNAEEQRYLKIFNNVDLSSNFYFSYSYDLSNTLQFNLSPFYNSAIDDFKCGFGNSRTLWDLSEQFISRNQFEPLSDHLIYIKPNMKFVWNEHLLSPISHIHNDFFLYICHGFVSQAVLPISGRNLMITLIARRSKKYAGTRFLKRGANCDGYPANEVETEQIVHDGNISSFRCGLFSSFVQLRGSVPTYWSQNIAKIVPKPPINIDLKDPFFEAAGKHFNNLLYNYGAPVVVVNLVKRKEKKPQESILYNEFEEAIEYLNQFLPKQHQIVLVGFDMARANKSKDQNVISSLTEIGEYTLNKTGFFQNRSIAINQSTGWPKTANPDSFMLPNGGSIMQTGITRVNCVDCLDRTNTAQFAIGRVALAHQLHTMGVLYKPELNFDTDIVRLLEELYEDHGDTLALQYGGSQLVHRIKTYRKIAPLTSQSKDIMQSLSRYYSNAFSDADKQMAINLFLGILKGNKSCPIWSITSDYSLHHTFVRLSMDDLSRQTQQMGLLNRVKYTKWWSDEVALCLPRAAKEFFKEVNHVSICDPYFIKRIHRYDWFFDIHRLHENIVFGEMFLFNVKKSKSYADVMSIKKLTNFRTQNRQSLVGIPLNTVSNDDSDPSDLSDCENDNIIIRFECEGPPTGHDLVHDSNEYDFCQPNHYGSNIQSLSYLPLDSHLQSKSPSIVTSILGGTPSSTSNTNNTNNNNNNNHHHQNRFISFGRELRKSYDRQFRALYRNLTSNFDDISEFPIPIYQEYLRFEERFGRSWEFFLVTGGGVGDGAITIEPNQLSATTDGASNNENFYKTTNFNNKVSAQQSQQQTHLRLSQPVQSQQSSGQSLISEEYRRYLTGISYRSSPNNNQNFRLNSDLVQPHWSGPKFFLSSSTNSSAILSSNSMSSEQLSSPSFWLWTNKTDEIFYDKYLEIPEKIIDSIPKTMPTMTRWTILGQ